MNKTTYNAVIEYFKNFSAQHKDIFSFIEEDEDQMSERTSKIESFPMMFVTPSSLTFEEYVDSFSFRIYFYDRLMKDRTNITDVRSRTQQLISDFMAWLKNDYDLPFDVEQFSNAYTFSSELMSYVTGWYIDVTIEISASSLCDIPFFNNPSDLDKCFTEEEETVILIDEFGNFITTI